MEEPGSLERALHAAVMEEDIKHLRHGLETMVGPRSQAVRWSSSADCGARMLVRDAELYVFDDLSSALDVETERKLWETVQRARRSDLSRGIPSKSRA